MHGHKYQGTLPGGVSPFTEKPRSITKNNRQTSLMVLEFLLGLSADKWLSTL